MTALLSGLWGRLAGWAIPNTDIETATYNAINDIVTDLNAARPITSGGTGSASAPTAQAALSLDNKVVTPPRAATTPRLVQTTTLLTGILQPQLER